MLKLWNVVHTYALATYLCAHTALDRLDAWASEPVTDSESERGSYSTEVVVVLALIVVMAVSVVTVIAAKVLSKANSISF